MVFPIRFVEESKSNEPTLCFWSSVHRLDEWLDGSILCAWKLWIRFPQERRNKTYIKSKRTSKVIFFLFLGFQRVVQDLKIYRFLSFMYYHYLLQNWYYFFFCFCLFRAKNQFSLMIKSYFIEMIYIFIFHRLLIFGGQEIFCFLANLWLRVIFI